MAVNRKHDNGKYGYIKQQAGIASGITVLKRTRLFIYHWRMPDEVRKRIRLVRETLNISQRDFAKRVYISQTLLGDIELGNRSVNDRTIQLISTEFNVNKTWLVTGEGQMFSAPPPDLQLEKLIEIFRQMDTALRDYLLDLSNGLLKIQKGKSKKPGSRHGKLPS